MTFDPARKKSGGQRSYAYLCAGAWERSNHEAAAATYHDGEPDNTCWLAIIHVLESGLGL